jgi:hypothetical protein
MNNQDPNRFNVPYKIYTQRTSVSDSVLIRIESEVNGPSDPDSGSGSTKAKLILKLRNVHRLKSWIFFLELYFHQELGNPPRKEKYLLLLIIKNRGQNPEPGFAKKPKKPGSGYVGTVFYEYGSGSGFLEYRIDPSHRTGRRFQKTNRDKTEILKKMCHTLHLRYQLLTKRDTGRL